MLESTRQGGPRDNEHVQRVLSWLAGRLLPAELKALSRLALFRWVHGIDFQSIG